MAMPSEYNEEIAEKICDRLSDGEPLRQICRDAGYPSWRTVYKWREQFPEFRSRIAHAREVGADAIAESILDIVDEAPERTLTQHGEKVDAGFVQWQRIRAEQRLKLLSKWFPKKYGERIDHTSSDGSMSPKEPVTSIEIVSPEFKALDDDSQAD